MSVFNYLCYIWEVKQSKVKDKIIETASFLFYRNGYNSTGINEIIAKAGIAKATLYSHFKSKEDICLAYLQYKNDNFIEALDQYLGTKRKGKNQVLGLFDFLETFFKDKDFNGCWCIKTVAELPIDNVKIRQEIRKQKEDFIRVIKKLTQLNLNISTEKENALLARRIYLLYEGAVGESHLHEANWPIKEAKNLCRQIIN